MRFYFTAFVREAEKRDIKIDYSKVSIVLGKPPTPFTAAEALRNKIVFDADYVKGKHKDHMMFLMFLMFHEAGHMPPFNYRHSADPQSIMAEGGVSAGGKLKLTETERIDRFFKGE